MADTRKVVKVFLASPGDLKEERRRAKLTVDEFNKLWADSLGYHIELVGWEDTVAAAGRPQALINRDLEGCELFLGMMFRRWGTPPSTSGPYTSGFEEEFKSSLDRNRSTGKPEISLLFKQVPDEFLRDPGPDLKQVLKFKTEIITAKEVLFEEFDDINQLETKVRACITKYVQRLRTEESDERSEKNQLSKKDSSTSLSVPDSGANSAL